MTIDKLIKCTMSGRGVSFTRANECCTPLNALHDAERSAFQSAESLQPQRGASFIDQVDS